MSEDDDLPGLSEDDQVHVGEVVDLPPKARAKGRGTPKASHVAEGPGARLARRGGFLLQPVSPASCRSAVLWGHQGLAVTAGSRTLIEASDPDVEAAGDSLYRLTELLPMTRVLVHAAPVAVFIGAEASLMRRIFAECPPGTLGHRLTHREPSPEVWQPMPGEGSTL